VTTITTAPAPPAPPRIDTGRLVALPVMTLLGLASLIGLWGHIIEPKDSGAIQVAVMARSLLLIGFYALVVRFYLLRSRARSTTGSWAARVSAVVATALPLPLALVSDPVENLAVLWPANVVTCAGLAWSVWSLMHLGRSLSIVAQARNLVRSGPYAIVRHPLYLGELTAVAGLVASGFTWAAVGLFVALVAIQLHRAGQEEQVLAQAFPEYADYRTATPAKVVPGLF
jgi:protein-S-isoprenylcysteine O-methyltransferase Ste14